MATDLTPVTAPRRGRRRRRFSQLTRRDKRALFFMTGIPTLIHVVFVWIPAITTIVLSFTKWDGLAPFGKIKFLGFKNYWQIFTIFKDNIFPALFNNAVLLVFLFIGPTLLGSSSPTCSTRASGARGSTRASTTSRSCCRWPWWASSGRA